MKKMVIASVIMLGMMHSNSVCDSHLTHDDHNGVRLYQDTYDYLESSDQTKPVVITIVMDIVPEEPVDEYYEREDDARDTVEMSSIESVGTSQNIDEYDQNICDDIQLPKLSPAKVFLSELLGSVLVRYIIIREKMVMCAKDVQKIAEKWFNGLVRYNGRHS